MPKGIFNRTGTAIDLSRGGIPGEFANAAVETACASHPTAFRGIGPQIVADAGVPFENVL